MLVALLVLVALSFLHCPAVTPAIRCNLIWGQSRGMTKTFKQSHLAVTGIALPLCLVVLA
ncbi:hypothetical protein SynA1562_00965 [Synechococcus sp. A15-62]|nr:hypothetical protein SynA1562_00965 [Synechococcus sp. A15-62]